MRWNSSRWVRSISRATAVALIAALAGDALYGHGAARAAGPRIVNGPASGAGSASTGARGQGQGQPGRGQTPPSNPPGGQTGPGKGPGGATTKRGDDMVEVEAEYGFVPGQTGQLSWNTTREVKDKPILLYVYDCEARRGDSYVFARTAERDLFRDEDVIALARDFVCEKTCATGPNFLEKIPKREMMQEYVTALSKQKNIEPHIALLDSSGKVITTLSGVKKLEKLGSEGFVKLLKKAAQENEKRIARP